jgi:hypothetical protein
MTAFSFPSCRHVWWLARCIAATGSALGLSACAIHPLPEDVTRETTVQIVKKIQCEAREALDDITVEYMRESSRPRTLELADKLEADQIEVLDLFKRHRAELDPKVITLAQLFTMSAVGMGFQFKITEDNDASASANFRLPFNPTSEVFSLGLGGGAKRTRESVRKFDVASTFNELHSALKREECLSIVATDGDRLYPITGKIGLKEVFRTFIALHEVRGTVKDNFSDQLTFTTKLNVSVTPKITLSPGPIDQFRLADASAQLSAYRLDEHAVTVTLKRADIAGAAKGAVLRQLETLRTEDFFERQRNIERKLDDIVR